VTDVVKDTLMHYAVRGGAPVVSVMLENKVPYKIQGARETPLQQARRLGKADVEALLRAQTEEELAARRTLRTSFRFLGQSDWKSVLGYVSIGCCE
jgi:hypothetical protein